MSTSPQDSDKRYCAKMLDGPEAGNAVLSLIEEPPDRIVVFRGQILASGMLMLGEDKGEYLEGDLIYEKVSRSELIDNPDWKGSKHMQAGCGYKFVDRPTPTVFE